MSKNNAKNIVKDVLERERISAEQAKKDLDDAGELAGFEHFNKFMPKEFHDQGFSRSNLGRGIKLRDQLLLGARCTTIDIRPGSKDSIERAFGFAFDDLLELRKNDRLRFNIYVRNPEAWDGSDDLAKILEVAYSAGARSDVFFGWMDSLYNKTISDFENDLAEAYFDLIATGSAEPEEFRKYYSIEDDPDNKKLYGTFGALGRRLGYLRSKDPEIVADIEELCRARRLLELNLNLHAAKHQYISRYTAAIGGDFYWGPMDDQLKAALSTDVSSKDLSRYYEPGRMEYLVDRINKIRAYNLPENIGQNALLDILLDADMGRVRDALTGALFDIERYLSGQVGDFSVANLENALAMHAETVSKYTKIGGRAGEYVGGVAGPFIGLLDPVAGAMISAGGVVLGKFAGQVVGESIAHSTNWQRHRFAMSIDNLDELYREILLKKMS
ncbi:MAG: DUF456 domain-containing protein [Burkholderiaceae bacterium]